MPIARRQARPDRRPTHRRARRRRHRRHHRLVLLPGGPPTTEGTRSGRSQRTGPISLAGRARVGQAAVRAPRRQAWPFATTTCRRCTSTAPSNGSPERSHTQGLIQLSGNILEKQGVQVEHLRAVDHDIATGVWPDMTEHGWSADAWPAIYQRVLAADILVIAGPIWLGDNSSVTKQVITLGTLAPTRISRCRRE
jgi:NADPH-dependent FMN reductase